MNRLNRALRLFLLVYLLLSPLAGWTQESSDRWRRLSPDEKAEVRRNYQRWQSLSPKDKEHLKEEWGRWQNLPKERRDKLQRRYEDLQRNRPKDSRRSRDE